MTIYAKTNKGRLLAFDNSHGLPAATKEFLRRIDGKTALEQLLVHPGDEDLLDDFIRRQWVQAVSTPWRISTYSSSQNDLNDADGPNSGRSHAFESDAEQFESTEAAALQSEPEVSGNLRISDAKVLMRDFVVGQMPEHYDAVINDIQALRNKADLLCMLSPYIDKAHRKGKLGQQHIQQLLATVADSN